MAGESAEDISLVVVEEVRRYKCLKRGCGSGSGGSGPFPVEAEAEA